jgi:crotonobetainyl-CoA:carnitine CoA-transferase CaiB-like acyl-CoA transferase
MAADNRPPQALAGIRVLDLAGEAGMYCTKLLADLGADVILIEPPGGATARRLGPYYGDASDPEKSLYFWNLNTNKRSVTLNLEVEEGREAFRCLAATADIIVECFQPGYLDSLGLGYGDLNRIKPDVILTSITGFGQRGPHSGYKAADIVGQAMSGMMHLAGFPDDPPNMLYGQQAYHCASIQATVGTLIALFNRERTGEGQQVDVSIQEANLLNQETAMQYWDIRRELRCRVGDQHPLPGVGTFECKDGHVLLRVGLPGFGAPWSVLLDWMSADGVVDEAALQKWRGFFAEIDLRSALDLYFRTDDDSARRLCEQFAEVNELLRKFLLRHTKRYLYEEGQRRGLLVGPVNTPKDIVESPQMQHRRWLTEVEHSELSTTILYPGPPYHLSETPWRIQRRAPLVGEHKDIIAEMSEAARILRSASLAQNDRSQKQALAGIRVADFSWYAAGPIASMVLAQHGAEVIKVESEAKPDGLRVLHPMPKNRSGLNFSGYFNNFNANKMSLTLNMGQSQARELALRLIEKCDVVIENYSPSVFEKWGLGYEALRQVRPDITYVRAPIQGGDGPHRDFAGYGAFITALAGLSYLTGFADRPPVGPGTNYSDFVVNPGHIAVAIMAALHYRDRTGKGQIIEVAQVESAAAVIGRAILDYTINVRVQGRSGNRVPQAAPHGAYRCQGEDRWCAIAVMGEEEWGAFCQATAHPEWRDDSRFATVAARKQHEDVLDALVEDWTSTRSAEEVMCTLQAAGVPAGVVQNARDLLESDAHLRERGHYAYLEHPEAGVRAYDGPPFRLSKTPRRLLTSAPCLGQHTEYVCKDILGLSDDEIAALVIDGVLK